MDFLLLDQCKKFFQDTNLYFPEKTRYRKISYFPDVEMKVRVIAQLDYFSQTALRPIHKFLYRVLRKLRCDCTFNQGKFQEILGGQSIYYSVDLTQATDRFPIKVISGLLETKFGLEFTRAWEDIMVGYPFDYKDEKIKYSVGNPMGAYSSWASFALTNHYLIYYCCKKLGISFKTLKYALLGDDIVIAHKGVAELYIQTVRNLGVEISEMKSHISPDLYEFAKR